MSAEPDSMDLLNLNLCGACTNGLGFRGLRFTGLGFRGVQGLGVLGLGPSSGFRV